MSRRAQRKKVLKKEKGCRNFYYRRLFHCRLSDNRILHSFAYHTAAQQHVCIKKYFKKKKSWKTVSATTTEFCQPGVSCACGKYCPTELGDATQNAPWHKCRQQPNNIHQHLSGVTLNEWVRGMSNSKRRVRPKGEQRENRSMAFAQSFDLSL